MGTVIEVLDAIYRLSPKERRQVLDSLLDADGLEWDHQITEDANSGRLDDLFADAIHEFEAGQCRKLCPITLHPVSGCVTGSYRRMSKIWQTSNLNC